MKIELHTSAIVTVIAKDPYNDVNLEIVPGEEYDFEVLPNQRWTDKGITRDAAGFWNPLLILSGKRVRDAKCFELCGCVNKDEKFNFKIGLSLKNYQVPVVGKLYLFANDSKVKKKDGSGFRFYDNNSGSIEVKITRVR